MVEASEFAANESLLAFSLDAGRNTASVSVVQDQTDAGADLLYRDRRCQFFFPVGLPLSRTM